MEFMNLRRSNRRLRFTVFLLTLMLAGTWLSHCRTGQAEYPRDEAPRFQEVWSYGAGEVKAVRIPLEGVIARPEGEGFFGARPDRVERVLAQIRAAGRDPEVRAVLLEVNSPGGSVTSSDEVYNALTRFRQSRPDRRVVVFIRDLGASGAYYAALAGDLIMAEPTSVVGSVGVILQTINLQGLSEKAGITDVTIKSGANKDLLNPFQPVDKEQIGLLQKLIDDMQDRFAGLTAGARNLNPETSPEVFDGRIFSAPDALAKGLIDAVGYWEDAVVLAADLLDAEALRIIRYETPKPFIETLFEARGRIALPDFHFNTPRFLYLWRP